jgi:hypothetical protein
MAVALAIITGVATGVLASALFWLWQAKLLRPRLIICPTLAKYALADGDTRYQFKVTNAGRRAVADIRIWVKVLMPDLVTAGSTEVIAILEVENPWMRAGGYYRRRIHPGQMPDTTRRSYGRYFPPDVRDAL